MKKYLLCLLAICTLLSLTGCGIRERVLITSEHDAALLSRNAESTPAQSAQTEERQTDEGENLLSAETAHGEPEQNAPTQNDPDARLREYASDASAELSPDAQQVILVPGTMPEENTEVGTTDETGTDAQQTQHALLTITETLTLQEAEKLGVSEQAPRADTSYQFYQAMLESRLSTLFECERLYVYWETPVDYQTVFKTSDEHSVILLAGGYDVSAKRLEDALLVDDGWISRKNPGCILKCVDADVLGVGVQSTSAANAIYTQMIERPGWITMGAVKSKTVLLLSGELLNSKAGQLAAALYMAKVMYPDLFTDLDPNEAWQLLRQEGIGTPANGIFAYAPEGRI